MKSNILKYILSVGFLIFLIACSVKKDKFINRNFHAVTTEYNVLYNGNIALDKGLVDLKATYKDNFWDPFKLDLIPSFDISFLIFDTAINMGLVKAIKFAQQAVGLKETGKYDDELFNRLVKYGKK